MQSRLKWWLIGIILLTVAGLLAVWKPVTIQPRTDSAQMPIPPISEAGPFKFYRPASALRLGLDLRGGTQLRLQLQKSAVSTYMVPEILEIETPEERSVLQGQIGELLPPSKLRAPGATHDPKRDIEVTETGVRITTSVRNRAEVDLQREIIDEVITSLFADAKHTEDSPEYIGIGSKELGEVKDILEGRINIYGVSEAIFQIEEPDKILVELPGVRDPEQAKELLRASAVLEFRLIPSRYTPSLPRIDPETGEETIDFYRVLAGGRESTEEVPTQKVLDESTLLMTGRDLKNDAFVDISPGATRILMNFKPEASKRWADYTRNNINRFIVIVLDGTVLMAPRVDGAITEGKTQITGGFEGNEGAKRAQNLVIKLNGGALPNDIVPVEQREVSATLGDDSLRASLIAGIIGFLAVLVFMIAYYRLPGVLASVALIIYLILLLAALKSIDATLTLPGIFGIILSVGMAVDANIIIFERLKEELRTGKTMRAAIEAAFKRAWTAILDSNVCSILTGLVLYWLGTGPVKGFAITLIIGVAVSMFTAITITRLFMDIAGGSHLAGNTALFGVPKEELEHAR